MTAPYTDEALRAYELATDADYRYAEARKALDRTAAAHTDADTRRNGDDSSRRGDVPGSSWRFVDLAPILDGTIDDERAPALLERADGVHLLYLACLVVLAGLPEAGKSLLALVACAQAIQAGRHVVYVDHEDGAEEAVRRLLELGVSRDAILARFHYCSPQEALDPDVRDGWLAGVAALDPVLVVIDGVTEGLAIEGLNADKGTDVAAYFERLPKRLAALGACVLLLDHLVKSREARADARGPIGSGHKLAAVTLALTIENVTPFDPEHEGRSDVFVTKDRRGLVRRHVVGPRRAGRIASMRVTPYPDGGTVVALEPPASDEMPRTPEGRRAPTTLMTRVVDYLCNGAPLTNAEDVETWASGRDVRKYVRGDDHALGDALVALVELGCVEHRTGKRGAHRYRYVRAFEPDVLNGETP